MLSPLPLRRRAAAVLVLGMTGALAACGTVADGGATRAAEGTAEETATPEPPTERAATRATRQEFRAGLEEMLAASGHDPATLISRGADPDIVDAYYSCIVDESYDELSDGFVNAIADTDILAPITETDEATVNGAVERCVALMISPTEDVSSTEE